VIYADNTPSMADICRESHAADSWQDEPRQVWCLCEQCKRPGPPGATEAAAAFGAIAAGFILELPEPLVTRYISANELKDAPRLFCNKCAGEFLEGKLSPLPGFPTARGRSKPRRV
jgi:hypothetical protein